MKRTLKAVWRATLPARRPVQSKLETFLAGCLARALETHSPTKALADEVNVALDAVIAEQFRLQARVDELARLLEEATADRPPVAPLALTRSGPRANVP